MGSFPLGGSARTSCQRPVGFRLPFSHRPASTPSLLLDIHRMITHRLRNQSTNAVPRRQRSHLQLATKVRGPRGEAFDTAVKTMKYRGFVTASEQADEKTGDDPRGPGTPTVAINGPAIDGGLYSQGERRRLGGVRHVSGREGDPGDLLGRAPDEAPAADRAGGAPGQGYDIPVPRTLPLTGRPMPRSRSGKGSGCRHRCVCAVPRVRPPEDIARREWHGFTEALDWASFTHLSWSTDTF